MKALPAISVIVPVYNVERFLPRCVDSILAQDINTGIEMILVDDGSTDNSGRICDKYAAANANIHVIHKQNGGVSTARNAGIDVAHGKYICFVDSDDELPLSSLSDMWEQVSAHPGVDVVCGQVSLNDTNNLSLRDKAPDFTEEKKVIRSLSLWELLGFSAVGRLVSRDVVVQNNIRFISGITHGEDPLWVFFLHKYVSSVAQCRKIVYTYNTDNDNSAMHVRDLTKAYCSTLKCASIACYSMAQDFSRKIEQDYILDLLSVGRYIKAISNGNVDMINRSVKNMYLSVAQKTPSPHGDLLILHVNSAKGHRVVNRKLPFVIRVAAWRLTLGQNKVDSLFIRFIYQLSRLLTI